MDVLFIINNDLLFKHNYMYITTSHIFNLTYIIYLADVFINLKKEKYRTKKCTSKIADISFSCTILFCFDHYFYFLFSFRIRKCTCFASKSVVCSEKIFY